MEGTLKISRLFFASRFNLYQGNEDGNTRLMIAYEKRYFAAAKKLLEKLPKFAKLMWLKTAYSAFFSDFGKLTFLVLEIELSFVGLGWVTSIRLIEVPFE